MSASSPNLQSVIDYFKSIDGRVANGQDRAVSQGQALSNLRDKARAIVDSTVYQAYSPEFYTRTNAIFEEIISDSDALGCAQVGLPLNFNTASQSGSESGQNTYAIFMLPEFYADSFINGVAARASLPRPFLDDWFNEFVESVPEKLAEEIGSELAR